MIPYLTAAENDMRKGLRELQRSSQRMRAGLRGMTTGEEQHRLKLEAEISNVERLMTYITHALSTLPDDPDTRVTSVIDHLQAIQILADGFRGNQTAKMTFHDGFDPP